MQWDFWTRLAFWTPTVTSLPPGTAHSLLYVVPAFILMVGGHGLLSLSCGHQGSEIDTYFLRDAQPKPRHPNCVSCIKKGKHNKLTMCNLF